jgi:hypothetical protein
LQAQTRQILCPVSDGSFLSAPACEFDVPTPGGSPLLEDVPEVEPVVVLEIAPVVVLEDCVLDRVPEDCVPEN